MNERGEAWVIGQFLIGAAILVAPPGAPLAGQPWLRAVGLALALAGALFILLAMRALGRNLTPFPRPIEGGELVSSGPYGLVRHPIYTGVLLGALGWALMRGSPLGLLLSLLLALFFDAKARREERWLVERYPDYDGYRQRVRRLIPWLY